MFRHWLPLLSAMPSLSLSLSLLFPGVSRSGPGQVTGAPTANLFAGLIRDQRSPARRGRHFACNPEVARYPALYPSNIYDRSLALRFSPVTRYKQPVLRFMKLSFPPFCTTLARLSGLDSYSPSRGNITDRGWSGFVLVIASKFLFFFFSLCISFVYFLISVIAVIFILYRNLAENGIFYVMNWALKLNFVMLVY